MGFELLFRGFDVEDRGYYVFVEDGSGIEVVVKLDFRRFQFLIFFVLLGEVQVKNM